MPLRNVSPCSSEPEEPGLGPPWPVIDVVYTWVNGSDPRHLRELEKLKVWGLARSNMNDHMGKRCKIAFLGIIGRV